MNRLRYLWHRLRGHRVVPWGYRLSGGQATDVYYCGHCRRELGR